MLPITGAGWGLCVPELFRGVIRSLPRCVGEPVDWSGGHPPHWDDSPGIKIFHNSQSGSRSSVDVFGFGPLEARCGVPHLGWGGSSSFPLAIAEQGRKVPLLFPVPTRTGRLLLEYYTTVHRLRENQDGKWGTQLAPLISLLDFKA
jgi:hypothetical protein